MEKVTRENCEFLNNFEHTKQKNADGSRIRARRNGKTKTWINTPYKFRIPVKYGLQHYFYITNENCNDWEGIQ
jgi:hypothetical protein